MPDRTPLVAGNWKMNPTAAGAEELARSLASAIGDRSERVDVAVCPPFLYTGAVRNALNGAPIALGAQDAYPGEHGAFTGEISVAMLAEAGVSTVLTGHSERRHVLHESDELIRDKTHAILDQGLSCILCIGETLDQREAGETDAVNEHQLRSALTGLDAGTATERLTIAYEPVWAIGTGKTASPADAQAAHARVRAVLADLLGSEAASSIRVLYGGSMKPANAGELMSQPDIDGGLIGGAALKAEDFLAIIDAASGVTAP